VICDAKKVVAEAVLAEASFRTLMTSTLLLPPFEATHELVDNNRCSESLAITFPKSLPRRANQQPVNVAAFLEAELSSPVIDEMYDWLWFVAARNPERVDMLHDQRIKKRNINIAENSSLHLTWYYEDIYLKPIPLCLFNFDFWIRNLSPSPPQARRNQISVAVADLSPNCRWALGFLRSYAFLIRYESDFRIAQREHLVPDNITYEAFQSFISPFRVLADTVVAKRFHYGQLRQTRLDYAMRILRPKSANSGLSKFYYHERYWQSGQVLRAWAPTLLFLFALLSLILSSMQVALAAINPPAWEAFKAVSRILSVVVTFICGIVIVGIPVIIFVVLCTQLIFAVRQKLRRVPHIV
jgi:hypothetical protein